MSENRPGNAIAPFKPNPRRLLDQIRSAAADSRKVAWSDHALDRMEERDITTLDALRVLRTGDVVGDISPGRKAGEWKCKVVARRKGARDIGVATIVLSVGRLFVKTVEWEDL